MCVRAVSSAVTACVCTACQEECRWAENKGTPSWSIFVGMWVHFAASVLVLWWIYSEHRDGAITTQLILTV